uniref:Uncharacterized protein n=1 Tax=Amphimedon queenslandica TaxID=400682 RepID=A0A1X7VPY5_AMPQE
MKKGQMQVVQQLLKDKEEAGIKEEAAEEEEAMGEEERLLKDYVQSEDVVVLNKRKIKRGYDTIVTTDDNDDDEKEVVSCRPRQTDGEELTVNHRPCRGINKTGIVFNIRKRLQTDGEELTVNHRPCRGINKTGIDILVMVTKLVKLICAIEDLEDTASATVTGNDQGQGRSKV